MIDMLLHSTIIADGRVVKLERDDDGLKMVCKDGSGVRVNHVGDRMGDLWILDVWTEAEVINISATSKHAANAVWVEAFAERGGWMVYDILFMVGCLLRYGWWTHSVIAWDGGELRVVARDTDASEGFVISIDAVYGVGFDEDDEEDGLEEDVCGC